MQDFKKMQAWQRAHALEIAVHRLVRPFSRRGHSHLRSQLTRAVEGIGANIAEGCGATSKPEFARFLDIAVKSANETEHHLLCARDHGLVTDDVWQHFHGETVAIRKMAFAYRRKILESIAT